MRDSKKAERQRKIEDAAYALLDARGYAGTSMLSIAKAARASNESLYRWYGDKNGLLKTMVESNARATRVALETAIDNEADPLATLETVAPVLLSMLLSEKAISLNRAAASDEAGELGATIAASGRDAVFPLLRELIQRGIDAGAVTAPSAGQAAEWFLGLLIGDLQIRRAIRVLPVPSEEDVRSRSAAAVSAFTKLCAP